ncbi:GNAT family N-acetyltransferase [Streptomyces sp. J2-1]|uniref:GNAT family N-acetyltransferase n=1 Tax=Streptomyces corallincola TaxID=2851888 RepID=UPI001C393383|nr:GNAT family N-acetyltransferase [Streptomyces corallincola]MBV2356695.1 GNAT family N-acetyltransferase [Streptomyces corallincola]
MTTTTVRLLSGAELVVHRAELRRVYADAFRAPPWYEDEAGVDRFAARLDADVHRPGFVAALALDGPRAVGFATAWTTPSPFPVDRCHPQAAAALGSARTAEWLSGAREVDEIAVRPDAQGSGVGACLLRAVTESADDGRCWLLTSLRSARSIAFYHRQGWAQATHPAPEGRGVVVFLGPRHPAHALAVQSL